MHRLPRRARFRNARADGLTSPPGCGETAAFDAAIRPSVSAPIFSRCIPCPPGARKIIYACSFELLGLAVSTLALLVMSDASPASSFWLSVVVSVMALIWNYIFNTMFEGWEAGQKQRGRSPRRRLAHALLFGAGFMLMTVPVIIWALGTDSWHGLAYDLGLTVVFVIYTYLFTLAFDRLFGLPLSAR